MSEQTSPLRALVSLFTSQFTIAVRPNGNILVEPKAAMEKLVDTFLLKKVGDQFVFNNLLLPSGIDHELAVCLVGLSTINIGLLDRMSLMEPFLLARTVPGMFKTDYAEDLTTMFATPGALVDISKAVWLLVYAGSEVIPLGDDGCAMSILGIQLYNQLQQAMKGHKQAAATLQLEEEHPVHEEHRRAYRRIITHAAYHKNRLSLPLGTQFVPIYDSEGNPYLNVNGIVHVPEYFPSEYRQSVHQQNKWRQHQQVRQHN